MIFETWKKFFTQSQFFRTSQLTAHCYIIVSIDRMKGIRSNRQQAKRFRELPFEKGLRMLAFSIRRIYITINGLSRCIVPSPSLPLHLHRTESMIDSTTAGKKLCARHTPGEISLRDESRNARFQYKMDYPSPLEQKRRVEEHLLTIWRKELKFRNLFWITRRNGFEFLVTRYSKKINVS